MDFGQSSLIFLLFFAKITSVIADTIDHSSISPILSIPTSTLRPAAISSTISDSKPNTLITYGSPSIAAISSTISPSQPIESTIFQQSVLKSTAIVDDRTISISNFRSTTPVQSISGSSGSNSVTLRSNFEISAVTPSATSSSASINQSSNANQPIDNSIVTDVISSLVVPGAASAAMNGLGAKNNPLGSIGVLPAISKLSGPLAQLIASKGNPSADNVNQLLKVVPEVAIMAGIANAIGGGKSIIGESAAGSLANITGNDQIGKNDQSISTDQTAQSPPITSHSAPITDFSNLTKQQIDDLISGAIPLPPISALPPDYVQTVLSGGSLPGLTLGQTEILKQRYMAQMFGGGGGIDSMFGQAPSIGQNIDHAPTKQSGGEVNGNQSADQSINQSSIARPTNQPSMDQSIPGSAINQSISKAVNSQQDGSNNGPKSPLFDAESIQELKNLDLSLLPPDLLKDFLNGKTPDIGKIPQDFLQSLISKTPRLFAKIVNSQLENKFVNRSAADRYDEPLIKDQSISISSDYLSQSNQLSLIGHEIPYDVNSLDRKADISMYRQEEDNDQAKMCTAIILGSIGLSAVIAIAALCWRRQRNRRRKLNRLNAMNSGMRLDQIATAVIDETSNRSISGHRDQSIPRVHLASSSNQLLIPRNDECVIDGDRSDRDDQEGQWASASAR